MHAAAGLRRNIESSEALERRQQELRHIRNARRLSIRLEDAGPGGDDSDADSDAAPALPRKQTSSLSLKGAFPPVDFLCLCCPFLIPPHLFSLHFCSCSAAAVHRCPGVERHRLASRDTAGVDAVGAIVGLVKRPTV